MTRANLLNTPFVVLSGGSHSGKSTLIQEISRLGIPTLPETAIGVIDELSARMGVEEQAEWRRRHFGEFEVAVTRRQVEQEEQALRRAPNERTFLDRGRHDAVAYCRALGVEVPPEITRACLSVCYRRIFLLETLPDFSPRTESGRFGDFPESVAVLLLLDGVYRDHGYEPVRVPVMSVPERLTFILGRLEKDCT